MESHFYWKYPVQITVVYVIGNLFFYIKSFCLHSLVIAESSLPITAQITLQYIISFTIFRSLK
jgi:hypothetical protein